MLIDPCYVLEDRFNLGGEPTGGKYDKACRITTNALGYGEFEGGFVTGTYAGDGAYPVYANLDENGKVMSVTIVFYDEDEDDDAWRWEDDEDEYEDDES